MRSFSAISEGATNSQLTAPTAAFRGAVNRRISLLKRATGPFDSAALFGLRVNGHSFNLAIAQNEVGHRAITPIKLLTKS